MSVAWPLRGHPRQTGLAGANQTARITAVDLHHDLHAAEPVWRHLQSQDALTTPYQAYDFVHPGTVMSAAGAA